MRVLVVALTPLVVQAGVRAVQSIRVRGVNLGNMSKKLDVTVRGSHIAAKSCSVYPHRLRTTASNGPISDTKPKRSTEEEEGLGLSHLPR